MKLLLDTSPFLWFISAASQLPADVRAAIQSRDNDVYLSVISLWEIVVKHHLGRLPLPEDPSRYIPRQRERHRIDSLSLHETALSHLGRLPSVHRDPFDRMLICQAIEHSLTLVTRDPAVRAYPVKTLWTS